MLNLLPHDVTHYVVCEYLDVVELTKLRVCGIKDILKCRNEKSVEVMLHGNDIVPMPLDVLCTLNKHSYFVNKLKLKDICENEIIEDWVPALINQASKLSFLCISCNGSFGEQLMLQHAINIVELRFCNEWMVNLSFLSFLMVNSEESLKLVSVDRVGISLDLSQCYELESLDYLEFLCKYYKVAEFNLSHCYSLNNSALHLLNVWMPQLQTLNVSYCFIMTSRIHNYVVAGCTIVGSDTIMHWNHATRNNWKIDLQSVEFDLKIQQRQRDTVSARKCNKVTSSSISIIKLWKQKERVSLSHVLLRQFLDVARLIYRTTERISAAMKNFPFAMLFLCLATYDGYLLRYREMHSPLLTVFFSNMLCFNGRWSMMFKGYVPIWLLRMFELAHRVYIVGEFLHICVSNIISVVKHFIA